MGARIRACNWSRSALGKPDEWPDNIKSAVGICLNLQSPVVLGIGSELRVVYNDASIPFLGSAKHPAALGEPGGAVFKEIWPAIEPRQNDTAASSSTLIEDVPIFLHRTLPREEAYITVSCSPILGAASRDIQGWFCTCTETTEKVVGARRSLTVHELEECRKQGDLAAVLSTAAGTLWKNPFDLPYAAIYELDTERRRVKRLVTAGIAENAEAFPEYHVLGDPAPAEHWCFSRALDARAAVQVDDVYGSIGFLPSGPWQDAARTALVFPLLSLSRAAPPRTLILGASSRCVLDPAYRAFLNAVARQIEHLLAEARIHPTERVQSGGETGNNRMEPKPEVAPEEPARQG